MRLKIISCNAARIVSLAYSLFAGFLRSHGIGNTIYSIGYMTMLMTALKLPEVIDRQEEVRELLESLSSRKKSVNYALIGPRQIGKTTILRELRKRLEEKGVVAVHLDFGVYRYAPIDFPEALIKNLLNEYASQSGTLEKVIARATGLFSGLKGLKHVRPVFEIGTDQPPSVMVHLERVESNPREGLELAFRYADGLAKDSGRKVVVILDEFQHFVEFDSQPKLRGALDVFRAAVDARGDVSYVVSGSRVHFLRDVLENGRSPLFGRFNIKEVGGLGERYAKELFMKASGAAEGDAGEAYGLVGGHPFYLLALAENRKAGERVAATYDRLLTSPTGALRMYANYILAEDLGPGTGGARFVKVLRALGPGPLAVSSISKSTGIKLTNLPWYLGRLIEYDLIGKKDGEYSIEDRVIRDYFAKASA
ncbi:MAG: AAA family ATPase [Nitrososphaerota archaeon]|nr:AAA family ATPase [Nitrososphaerota archaeon]